MGMSQPHHFQKVITIINPAATPTFPILSQLNQAFSQHGIDWDIVLTKKTRDSRGMVEAVLAMQPDAIAVYGGDGTVLEVAAEFYGSELPLVILPGGTANIMAKELGIPLEISSALNVFAGAATVQEVDVAVCDDGSPMILRVEVGVLADMVKGVDRDQKDALGVLAYPISAVQNLVKAEPSQYHLILDDNVVEVEGVGLMVANFGNVGIPGISLQSSMSCTDGLLDVIVLESKDLGSLLSLGTSTLIGLEKPPTVKHWQVKHLEVTVEPKQTILRDDASFAGDHFSVKVSDKKLKVLV